MDGLREHSLWALFKGSVMQRILQIPLVLAVLASSSAAQNADTSSIILAPKAAESPAAPASAPVERVVSPGIGADLAASLPAYSPPSGATTAGDLREKDKPRNQIPRIPIEMMQKYVVHEDRVPVFQPLEFYTKVGLTALSFKEHPGRRIGNFFAGRPRCDGGRDGVCRPPGVCRHGLRNGRGWRPLGDRGHAAGDHRRRVQPREPGF